MATTKNGMITEGQEARQQRATSDNPQKRDRGQRAQEGAGRPGRKPAGNTDLKHRLDSVHKFGLCVLCMADNVPEHCARPQTTLNPYAQCLNNSMGKRVGAS